MTADEVRALIVRARAAQPEWEALGFDGRKRALLRARAIMARNTDRFIEAIVRDTRKPYEDAQLEVLSGISSLHFWAHRAEGYLKEERVRTRNPFAARQKLAISFAPRGVIGVIGPWNVPMINSFGDCIPALAAGNAVVLKPSELTPSLALLCEELLAEAGVPEGIYSVAVGAGETGEALIDGVDFIQSPVPRRPARPSRRAPSRRSRRTRSSSAQGPDDRLRRRRPGACGERRRVLRFGNAGQICVSVERVYVEDAVHDAFVELVVEKTRALRQGLAMVSRGASTSAR